MATRYLYIARHGEADPFGTLNDTGPEQSRCLGRRLAPLPIDAVWHSPLPRAADSARELNIFFSGSTTVREDDELIDHVPYVPPLEETPPSWVPFFDGYDADEAATGQDIAQRLTTRFTAPAEGEQDSHEVLITHDYPIAWLIRHTLGAPPQRWLGLNSANAALTIIDVRPDLPGNLVLFNDMSHLEPALQWTGFPTTLRP